MSILFLLFTCGKLTPLRWSQFLLMAFQLTVFKSPVTSLIVNASITVLTCPFILLNVNSTGAVSKVATAPFITLTWLIHISPCKPNFAAISAFRYVCVLPSSNRAFMVKLILPFSTMIGVTCNEIHLSFWHPVAINDFVVSPFPWGIFLIDVLDSSLIHHPGWHCVTFYCAFLNIHLCCKLTCNCILQLCDFLPNNRNTTHEFLQSPIFVVYSYF